MDAFSVLFDMVGTLSRRRYQAAEQTFGAIGLNHSEARLLTLLARAGGRAAQDNLSNELHIDKSNAGRALKKLESDGHVARRKDADDKRAYVVTLTAKGQKTAGEIAKLRKKMAQTFFGEMTEKEAGIVAGLLKKALP